MTKINAVLAPAALVLFGFMQPAIAEPAASHPIVLHAARLFDIDTGKVSIPGEVLIDGERITAVGSEVGRPRGTRVIDLGNTTLLPGLIDVHVHLFLHPGA